MCLYFIRGLNLERILFYFRNIIRIRLKITQKMINAKTTLKNAFKRKKS